MVALLLQLLLQSKFCDLSTRLRTSVCSIRITAPYRKQRCAHSFAVNGASVLAMNVKRNVNILHKGIEL
jgi:hypothetical protein